MVSPKIRLGVGAAILLGCGLLLSCGSPPEVATEAPAPPPPFEVVEHRVHTGETLDRIADLYYGDPAAAAVIAARNGVGVDAELVAGSVVELPLQRDQVTMVRRRQAALDPYNRGVAALEQGDLETAERQFQLALRTAEGLHAARYNLALVQMRRGRHEDAATLLTALVAERPEDADYGFALGNSLFHQTSYDAAAAAFAAVLIHHRDHRRSAFGHARALQEAGRSAEARQAWDTYLQLDSTSPWADEARRLRAELPGS